MTNTDLPVYLRLYYATIAKAWYNGHWSAEPSEMAYAIGISPKELSRAVRRAVYLGLLAPESASGCLVHHHIGNAPSARDPCRKHANPYPPFRQEMPNRSAGEADG